MAGKSKTITFRLTEDEYSRLSDALGHASLSSYIRAILFNQPLQKIQTRYAAPVADREALSQVLAKLGQTRLPQNINQIAHAANSGILVLPEDALQDINMACLHIDEMRQLVNKALGQKART